MSRDATPGPTRRQVIERGALAAGLVWATPALRSVRVLQATGTPPPATTSNPPPPTVITFSGIVNTSQGGLDDAPDCPGFVLDVFGSADLDPIGPTQLALQPCFMFPPDAQNTYHPAGAGHFVLTPSGGTITGTVAGPLGPTTAQQSLAIDWTLHVTGGTGTYAGATGTGTFVGELIDIGQAQGTLSCTIEPPFVADRGRTGSVRTFGSRRKQPGSPARASLRGACHSLLMVNAGPERSAAGRRRSASPSRASQSSSLLRQFDCRCWPTTTSTWTACSTPAGGTPRRPGI